MITTSLSGWSDLNRGWRLLVDRRRKIGLCTTMMITTGLLCYLALVAVNSAIFRYNYFTTPAPRGAANVSSAITTGLVWLGIAVGATFLYGVYCVIALESRPDPIRSTFAAGYRAFRRRWWRAVPLMTLTCLGVAVILGGPLLVPFSASIALADCALGHPHPVSRASARALTWSLPSTCASILVWLAATRFRNSSPSSFVVATAVFGVLFLGAVAAAWTASAAASSLIVDASDPLTKSTHR